MGFLIAGGIATFLVGLLHLIVSRRQKRSGEMEASLQRVSSVSSGATVPEGLPGDEPDEKRIARIIEAMPRRRVREHAHLI